MNSYLISAVIATYEGETASNLYEALDSLKKQTTPPAELIIVGDGPLPEDQIQVIERIKYEAEFPVTFLQLPVNVGRGMARNEGIRHCKFDWICVMDSDDICNPRKLELQLSYLKARPHIDLVATLTEEFVGDFSARGKGIIKSCPEHHASIAKALKISCCISNPTILFRKQAWLESGGFGVYRNLNEDYLFFLRLVKSGKKIACIQEPLLYVRVGAAQRNRRRGLKLLKNDIEFRRLCYREGHVGFFTNLFVVILLVINRLAPNKAHEFMQRSWRNLSRNLHK